ncbi:MAG: HD domain-containing protein [Myxococcota bacterium]|jgi:hypothetical protein|nr:HD domain-containing protein [Myxococcota bacterium]
MPNADPHPSEIRDPVHGAIPVTASEIRIVDHPFVQRLRGIRQLGFAHLPFPGATHTRYSHSLGAMHLAGRAFDACFPGEPFTSIEVRRAYRACIRLAALCHDLGHAPFSHSAEFAMPPLRDLEIRAYEPESIQGRLHQRASHEDYTVAILTQSRLGETIRRNLPFDPLHVACLVSDDVGTPDDFFVDDGRDYRTVLSQLVHSKLDVDRMDYLVRDSTFTGASYGQIDVDWLINNLTHHVEQSGRVCLALNRRAIYAFDDFMIARFHMFLMVYFHQKSVGYEELLKRYIRDPRCTYQLPADLERYRETSDGHLLSHLSLSDNTWARRIVELRPYRVVYEAHGRDGSTNLERVHDILDAAGFDMIRVGVRGSIYGHEPRSAAPIYVLDRKIGADLAVVQLEEATPLFERYHDERRINRLYVEPERLQEARELLEASRSRDSG